MTKAKPCTDCSNMIEMGYIHDNRPDDFLCIQCLHRYQDRLQRIGMDEFIADYSVEYVTDG
jgi:hypothetical protein